MPAVSVHAIARTASAPAMRGDSEPPHARPSAPATRARSSQMKSAAPASATAAGRSHERERTRMPAIRTLKPPVHQTATATTAATAVTASSQPVHRVRTRAVRPSVNECSPSGQSARFLSQRDLIWNAHGPGSDSYGPPASVRLRRRRRRPPCRFVAAGRGRGPDARRSPLRPARNARRDPRSMGSACSSGGWSRRRLRAIVRPSSRWRTRPSAGRASKTSPSPSPLRPPPAW